MNESDLRIITNKLRENADAIADILTNFYIPGYHVQPEDKRRLRRALTNNRMLIEFLDKQIEEGNVHQTP